MDVNGQTAKPNRLVGPGDELKISRPFGRKQRILVRAVAERHVAKAGSPATLRGSDAAALPEESRRGASSECRAAAAPTLAPDKRDRRALRKMKERG